MKTDTLYIFLGGFFNPKLLNTIKEDTRGEIGFSNHNFEMSIIKGLCENDINLKVVSVPRVYSFPQHNKRLFISEYNWTVGNKTDAYSVGFCNLWGLNKCTIPHNAEKALKQIIRHSSQESIRIIVDTPYVAYLQAVIRLKKKYKNRIKSCLIVPDIPQFITMLGGYTGIKRYLVSILDKKSTSLCKEVDAFVLLTEQMKDLLPVGDKPHIVMEGLIANNKATIQYSTGNTKSILYTGTLAAMYGIVDLLKAFEQIEDANTELWICGSGDAEEKIREAAQKDPRIKFFGLVDSDEALKLQQKASILVNPRTDEGEYTKYSFPSKTLEYLLAAKPVVMRRLPGIPHEYDEYLFYTDDNTIESLAATLKHVLAMSAADRQTAGEKGRDFVLKEKNAKRQTERIINFCNLI